MKIGVPVSVCVRFWVLSTRLFYKTFSARNFMVTHLFFEFCHDIFWVGIYILMFTTNHPGVFKNIQNWRSYDSFREVDLQGGKCLAPLGTDGTPWDPLRQFYMYVFQMLIARLVGARLTSKSLQNSFHAKENRIRSCCFWRVTDISPFVFEGLALRVDSRKTRNTREKCDFCSFSTCSRLSWLGMTP